MYGLLFFVGFEIVVLGLLFSGVISPKIFLLLCFLGGCVLSPIGLVERRVQPVPQEKLEGEIIRVVSISKKLMDQMIAQSKKSLPNETGGLVLGRYEDDRVIFVMVSDAGPMAKATPSSFLRDEEYTDRFAQENIAKMEGLRYVGEWHSHPSGDWLISNGDLKSMTMVANNPAFRTPFPVMAVVGVRGDESKIAFACIAPSGMFWYLDICDEEKCLVR
jgi:integrative and conjugative element protein (TIGR02256 family)